MIEHLNISSLAITGVFLVFAWNVIHTAFISPLSRIPCAHWSSRFSTFWILWIRFRLREIRTIHSCHQKYGPVIRLGPNEISVNCVKGGVLTVYGGGFEKHEWYPLMFGNYGKSNMFSTAETKPHSIRKRMLSNVYSKSQIMSSEAMSKITSVLINERFIPLLKSQTEIEIYPLLSAVTMDFITSYQFGLASNADFLRDSSLRSRFLKWYAHRSKYNFWQQEVPRLTQCLRIVGLNPVPRWVGNANQNIEALTFSRCASAKSFQDTSDMDHPTVYLQLKRAMLKKGEAEELVIASEMLDHLAAGFDTSGITLFYYIHEISKKPEWQDNVKKELDSIDTESYKALDALPILHATLQETLRLRPAIPGPQPRVTPASGCRIGPKEEYFVPGGVRISAQAQSLHHNRHIFKDPDSWKPERWLEADSEKLKTMHRWFWAFGSGGRMCVGSNLAYYQMKHVIAAIYSNWKTEIVSDDGVEQEDLYTAGPKSGNMIIKLISRATEVL